SHLMAEGVELKPLVEDEAFFALDTFRSTRFRLVLPEFRVVGLAYAEILLGPASRARSIQCSSPSFDALVNRDKPARLQRSLMVHEALAAIREPLQVDSLSIST